MRTNMELLRSIARERGLSLEEMAASAGMSLSTLYRKINVGGGKFTVEEARKIADTTGMTKEQAVAVFFS